MGLTMPKFNPPDSFQFDWTEWKQRFLRFRSATKLDRETPTVQVSSLVYTMGLEAEKIYSSFQLATTVPAPAAGADAAAAAAAASAVPDADNFDLMMKRFDAYFIPYFKRNVIHERAKFHLRMKQVGENAESFYRSLMELSETCSSKDKKRGDSR